jgi:O-antigen/teichoic acid export membrane protein
MSQSKFVKNLAILIILNLLIKPFWILGIEPSVQVKVGDTAYGEYAALFNFSFLLNILLDFGITNFNNKNIAQNNHLVTKHFSGLFVLKLALAFVYITATLVIGFFMGYESRYMKLLLILGFNQFLISMILYLRSNLLGLHLFKTDSIVSVLDRFIMIIFCGMLLWTNITGIQLDIMNFVYTQTLSYVLTAVIAFIMVMRKTTSFRLTWNWPFSLMILKKSFPFAVLVLLMTFYNRLDTVMIERLLPTNNIYLEKVIDAVKHNPELYAKESVRRFIDAEELKQSFTGAGQAGIYTKGFRLLDAANMIAFLFAMQLLPTFSRMLKYKESVEQLVKLSFTLLMTPALIISISCFFYSGHLTALINHGNTNSHRFSGYLCVVSRRSPPLIFSERC